MPRYKIVKHETTVIRRNLPERLDLEFLVNEIISESGITHIHVVLPAHLREKVYRPDALLAIIARPGVIPTTVTAEQLANYSQQQGIGNGLEVIPPLDPILGLDIGEMPYQVGVNTTTVFQGTETDLDAEVFVVARYPD